MSDIVERLRNVKPSEAQALHIMDLTSEAAIEIERLQERYDFQVAANRSLVEACAKAMNENDRLRQGLEIAEEALEPSDRDTISTADWNQRIKSALELIREKRVR